MDDKATAMELLLAEFNQNFHHLRDLDAKVLELLKFFVTMIFGMVTVAFGLLRIVHESQYTLVVRLFGAVGVLAGYLLTTWMLALRRYVVTCARQLNAIRE